MNPNEKLAILTALKKKIDEEIKTTREVVDDELFGDYEEIGVEKIALKVGGKKVGEHLITFTKEGYEVTNKDELDEFLLDYGMAYVKKEINPEKMTEAVSLLTTYCPEVLRDKVVPMNDWDKCITYIGGECYFYDSGTLVPGIRYVPVQTKNTMVRGCKPEDVFPIISKQLGGFNQLLLGE